ncbi:MAG TPA: prolyl oligopeptidase family serine peptidase, partial [Planctomycetota bacterium]|nr:prolyl oligopeptidase family serine peptidase [Planctomycetota bacterium]
EARAIIDERSETFIDYAGKLFIEFLDETDEIVWMSERDGWNHLYLYDATTGEMKGQITQGEWVVRGVDRVDSERREVWFRAGGIHSGQDPYHVHFARVGLDGSGLVLLTEGDGTHSISFSPDGRFYIDSWSRVDLPPVHELRRTEDGRLVCVLEEGDASALLEAGIRFPERFSAKGRDGETDIWGYIVRPRDFDPSLRYPVIEQIYAGPHSAHVPKSFRERSSESAIADRGFVIVRIDGMGTSHRSKRFHDVCWKNIGDAGFPDRIAWMRAAAAERPWMDITRVGIFGGSAGGQNALRALLAHGDFYDAAVADCGCHDNRMDKIWWNELWMGWPVGPHYEEQSNVTQAHRLEGKLLLVLGGLDRNVDPASTLQVVDALIEADKDFELLLVPRAGHGAGGSRYGRRRMLEFFERHLGGPSELREVASKNDVHGEAR